MSVIHERAVRFEDVDFAGIVFFPRFLVWCHEAMERFFDGIAGGYVQLVKERRVGFPTVHVSADWKHPLRYGDIVRIETTVLKIGATSVTLRYVLTRIADEGMHVATIEHVVVCSDLATMTKIPIPEDCRALLEAHRVG